MVHCVQTARVQVGPWRPTRLFTGVLAVVSLAVALVAPPAHGTSADRESPATHPAALWRAFPLREVPSSRLLPPTLGGDRKQAVPALPPAVVQTEDSAPWGFAAVLAVLVAGAVGAVVALRGPARRWSRAERAATSYGRLETPELFRLTPTMPVPQSYVLYLPGRAGWGDQLVEREGEPPLPGEIIVDDELGRTGQSYAVDELGDSPLPEDDRPCATLRAL
jgi:hypothetical protein